MTKENFQMPDYYKSIKKPRAEEELVKRKCFYCSKEKEMGKFQRYCSTLCRSQGTRNYVSGYKVGY